MNHFLDDISTSSCTDALTTLDVSRLFVQWLEITVLAKAAVANAMEKIHGIPIESCGADRRGWRKKVRWFPAF